MDTNTILMIVASVAIVLYFLRRRARISDRLLSYLPDAKAQALACADHLRALREGGALGVPLLAPDCAFAAAALDELQEQET